jgi:hypothetical protein
MQSLNIVEPEKEIWTAEFYNITGIDAIGVSPDGSEIELLMNGKWHSFIYNKEASRLIADRRKISKVRMYAN